MKLPSYPDLEGKVAVVTGGSRGIGAATCRLLAAQGILVTVIGRDEDAIAETVASIARAGGKAVEVAADVTDSAGLAHARSESESAFGPADLILPFAGVGLARPGPTEDIPEAAWRSSLEGNLTATFLSI